MILSKQHTIENHGDVFNLVFVIAKSVLLTVWHVTLVENLRTKYDKSELIFFVRFCIQDF